MEMLKVHLLSLAMVQINTPLSRQQVARHLNLLMAQVHYKPTALSVIAI